MTKTNVIQSFARANAFVAAAVIASAALIPALLLSGSASGAQLTSRFIDMSGNQTSEGSGRDGGDAFGQDVTYRVGFTIPTTGNVGGVVVQFCDISPITGDPCTAPTGFDANVSSLVLANQVGATGFSIDIPESSANLVVLNRTAASVTGPQVVTFDLGSTGASDGITNPTVPGTFYARILTFTTPALADAYTATVPGAFTDDGGIALSVANELTITARVQEVLEFCIGTETASLTAINTPTAGYDTGDSCAQISGTNLSLDVVGGNISTTSSITVPNDGVMMVRTNAINGVAMYYKAEQNTSSGALKITGATCVGTTLSDPCFNSRGATRAVIAAGTENFGVALKERVTTLGGATNVVACAIDYRGDATAGCTGAVAGNNYAWVDTGVFTSIASAPGPVDDELVALQFAATASPTTPTGLYTVTANFVATSTF